MPLPLYLAVPRTPTPPPPTALATILARYCVTVHAVADCWLGDASGQDWRGEAPAAFGARVATALAHDGGRRWPVGLGQHRVVALLAARLAPPGGARWLDPADLPAVWPTLPVAWLPAVQPAWLPVFNEWQVRTIGDLQRLPLSVVRGLWGAAGEVLYVQAQGHDGDLGASASPASISATRALQPATTAPAPLLAVLAELVGTGMAAVRARGGAVGLVELTCHYVDQRPAPGRQRLSPAAELDAPVLAAAERALAQAHRRRVAVAQLTLVLAGLTASVPVGDLFGTATAPRARRLALTVDTLRARYGATAVIAGHTLAHQERP